MSPPDQSMRSEVSSLKTVVVRPEHRPKGKAIADSGGSRYARGLSREGKGQTGLHAAPAIPRIHLERHATHRSSSLNNASKGNETHELTTLAPPPPSPPPSSFSRERVHGTDQTGWHAATASSRRDAGPTDYSDLEAQRRHDSSASLTSESLYDGSSGRTATSRTSSDARLRSRENSEEPQEVAERRPRTGAGEGASFKARLRATGANITRRLRQTAKAYFEPAERVLRRSGYDVMLISVFVDFVLVVIGIVLVAESAAAFVTWRTGHDYTHLFRCVQTSAALAAYKWSSRRCLTAQESTMASLRETSVLLSGMDNTFMALDSEAKCQNLVQLFGPHVVHIVPIRDLGQLQRMQNARHRGIQALRGAYSQHVQTCKKHRLLRKWRDRLREPLPPDQETWSDPVLDLDSPYQVKMERKDEMVPLRLDDGALEQRFREERLAGSRWRVLFHRGWRPVLHHGNDAIFSLQTFVAACNQRIFRSQEDLREDPSCGPYGHYHAMFVTFSSPMAASFACRGAVRQGWDAEMLSTVEIDFDRLANLNKPRRTLLRRMLDHRKITYHWNELMAAVTCAMLSFTPLANFISYIIPFTPGLYRFGLHPINSIYLWLVVLDGQKPSVFSNWGCLMFIVTAMINSVRMSYYASRFTGASLTSLRHDQTKSFLVAITLNVPVWSVIYLVLIRPWMGRVGLELPKCDVSDIILFPMLFIVSSIVMSDKWRTSIGYRQLTRLEERMHQPTANSVTREIRHTMYAAYIFAIASLSISLPQIPKALVLLIVLTVLVWRRKRRYTCVDHRLGTKWLFDSFLGGFYAKHFCLLILDKRHQFWLLLILCQAVMQYRIHHVWAREERFMPQPRRVDDRYEQWNDEANNTFVQPELATDVPAVVLQKDSVGLAEEEAVNGWKRHYPWLKIRVEVEDIDRQMEIEADE